MTDKDKKIDPFDVEALEKSLNDSATRVSTIWVSFLIFSLYLLTAATTVTHRQLFLAEPVKLPVLNIDLPLWGFFFLAPILFVILHAYVLIQVILLARTAAAYNEAADRSVLVSTDNARIRQRLANTLFAQIFAGSPREREGWLGRFLNAMAWITLAIAPILILFTFQFMFLPYHSHFATWTHRLLILMEFAVAFLLWPLVLNAQRDFEWPNLRWRITETVTHLPRLIWPKAGRHQAWRGMRRQALPLTASALFVLVSISLASFPGEPHVNLLTGQPLGAVQCKRWIHQNFDFADMRFDRLLLPRVDIVDDGKLTKLEQAAALRNQAPFDSERIVSLRRRDLGCGDFSFADLRFVDFTEVQMSGASLYNAELRGALLADANMRGVNLSLSNLQGASLQSARIQGARAISAKLQGASLIFARLQGSELANAQFQGATLLGVELQGSLLNRTNFQGADLSTAELLGASLDGAQLNGAVLHGAQLQGASLNQTSLDQAFLLTPHLWRARKDASCSSEVLIEPEFESIIITERSIWGGAQRSFSATPSAVKSWINQLVAEIFDEEAKQRTIDRLERGLASNSDVQGGVEIEQATAELEKRWRDCQSDMIASDFSERRAEMLRDLVCNAAADDRKAVVEGLVRNWVFGHGGSDVGLKLARALLAPDDSCAVAGYLDSRTKDRLQSFLRVQAEQ